MSRPQRKSPEALEGALGAHGGAQVGGAEQGRTYREPRISVQRNRPPHSRNLPAAVIEAESPAAAGAARIVPEGARRLKVGGAQLGYYKRRGRPSILPIRLQEIERIIALRYGSGGCDMDDAAVYLILGAHTLVPTLMERYAGREGAQDLIVDRVIGWCGRHVPAASASEVRRIAERAIREPRRFRADSAARLIRLTVAERTAARVTTIGACDLDAEGRKAVQRDAHRARSREHMAAKRRAAGARPMAEVRANSVAAKCRELGISASTYYRWLKLGKIQPEAPRENRVSHHRSSTEDIGAQRNSVTPKAPKAPTTYRMRPFRYYPALAEVRPTANPSAARAWDAATGSRPPSPVTSRPEPAPLRELPAPWPPEAPADDAAWLTAYRDAFIEVHRHG